MIKEKYVKDTIYISLLIQLTTTLISLDGLNYDLIRRDEVLHEILLLEAFVQFVEAGFYIWVILALKDLRLMTPRRYLDWFFTTPTMLVSTIIFMEYLRVKDSNRITLRGFLIENRDEIIKISLLNLGMLFFGYLGEIHILSKYDSIVYGSVCFVLAFQIIYDRYASKTKEGKILFQVVFGIWSLYAVAAWQPVVRKNVMYNILDIFSKNFYGLFIYAYIRQVGTRNQGKISVISGPSTIDS